MISLAKIKKAILKSDPGLSEGDEAFKAEVVLLASTQIGPNIRKLAKFTGFDRSMIAKFAINLRDSGVWSGSKVYGGDWFGENGGIALACDTCVALGWIKRAPSIEVKPSTAHGVDAVQAKAGEAQ